MTNSDVIRAWYSEVWESGNTEAIDQFFAPDTLAEGLIPEMQVGADDFRDLVMAFRHVLGDIKVDLPKSSKTGIGCRPSFICALSAQIMARRLR